MRKIALVVFVLSLIVPTFIRPAVAQDTEIIYTPSIEAKTFLDEALSFSTDCTGHFAAWTWGDFWEVWYLGSPEDQACQFIVPKHAVEFTVTGFEAYGKVYDHGDYAIESNWVGFSGGGEFSVDGQKFENPAWMTLFFSPRYLEPAN